MEKIVGLKDLRANMEKYASDVRKGDTIIVVKRSKPLFKIVPAGTITEPQQEREMRIRPFTPSAELDAWTKEFIDQYKPALEALADK